MKGRSLVDLKKLEAVHGLEMRVGVVRINYANEAVKWRFAARKKCRRPYVNEGEELSRHMQIGGGAWFGNACGRGAHTLCSHTLC